MPISRRLFLAAPALVTVAPAFAHHGWGGFDTSRVLDFTGPVARSTWANPHGTLWMMRERDELVIELAPVSRMQARGLAETEVAAGQRVRVFAYQNRGNPLVHRAEWIEVAGRRVELR
jgi:Family of unknown function (DUF6152)